MSCSRTWRRTRAAASSSTSTTWAWRACGACSRRRRGSSSAPWMSLADRHVLVTGGARGLGRAFAEALVRAGARVTIADILETGHDVAQRIGARFVRVDLSSPSSIENFAGQIPRLDGLVNNAAITDSGGRTLEEL